MSVAFACAPVMLSNTSTMEGGDNGAI
jgi:hypothetical protein